eukprot:COSAG01_NODE_7914_length_2995_cov_70.311119_3_plen_99_part_00
MTVTFFKSIFFMAYTIVAEFCLLARQDTRMGQLAGARARAAMHFSRIADTRACSWDECIPDLAYSTLQLFFPSHPPYNSNYITDTRGLRSPSVLDFLS